MHYKEEVEKKFNELKALTLEAPLEWKQRFLETEHDNRSGTFANARVKFDSSDSSDEEQEEALPLGQPTQLQRDEWSGAEANDILIHWVLKY